MMWYIVGINNQIFFELTIKYSVMINKPFAVGDDNQPLEKAAASNEIRDDY